MPGRSDHIFALEENRTALALAVYAMMILPGTVTAPDLVRALGSAWLLMARGRSEGKKSAGDGGIRQPTIGLRRVVSERAYRGAGSKLTLWLPCTSFPNRIVGEREIGQRQGSQAIRSPYRGTHGGFLPLPDPSSPFPFPSNEKAPHQQLVFFLLLPLRRLPPHAVFPS